MDAEDLIIDDGSQWEVIKDLCAIFPDIEASILPQALVVEAIDLCDLPRLVVAP